MATIRSYTQRKLRRLSHASLALLIALFPLSIPLTASAEDCEIPDFGPGVHYPTGADAATYTYNCETGLYENSHYTFDPVTTKTTPKNPPVYTYNPDTGKYDSGEWVFSAPTNTYVFSPFSVTQPPAGATVVGGPPPPADLSINNTGAGSNNTINNSGGVVDNASINGTGPGSNNTIDGSQTNNGTTNNSNTVSLNNNLNAESHSGDATVSSNVNAGDATSGASQSQADIINLLQSSSNALTGDTVTFVANIDGDVNGDFMLDPSLIGNPQVGYVGDSNLVFNNETDASINNTIDLTATSGDATVDSNTNGGSAQSGTARTIANVINVINSAIISGKSFVGTININGNLNGDILIPDDLVDQLIAANVPTVTIISNTGAGSNNAITSDTGSNNINATNTNNSGITNNINAAATSGDASVTGNTNAGDATTGNAKNSITAFNLTGSHIIGCNAILVFVNVVGEWVGMIVNAPQGANVAALGGCMRNAGSGNTNATIDNNSNLSINNDINSTAQSGDASVRNNTNAGGATSGDAENTINLLNIENSVISLDGWFGILFINVFGKWNGSFGINTDAGNAPIAMIPQNNSSGDTTITAPPHVFRFMPRDPAPASPSSATIENTGSGSTNAILASSKNTGSGQPSPQVASASTAQKPTTPWLLPVAGLVVGGLLLAAERVVSRRQQ